MSAIRIFNNHAGTTSDSFGIGKDGIQLLQGTGNPAGVSAPVGSLYVLKGTGTNNGVYQIDAFGGWSPLLFQTSIANGTGTTVELSNGVVTVNVVSTKYKFAFTSSDVTGGNLTVTHNLNEEYPLVALYNDSGQAVVPDQITSIDQNNIQLSLSSFNITHTWNVTILSGF